MKKSLCHIALEHAGIEATDCRVAVFKCIHKLPQSFSLSDIQQRTRYNGKPINRSTLTHILLLFRSRKIIGIDHQRKPAGRGRPVTFYKLI